MENEKSTRGRKPVDNPKKLLRLWIHADTIKRLGGEINLRDRLYGYIKRAKNGN
jgi:hypothetical protein